MRTSPPVMATMAGTAMATACWALIALMAEKTTVLTPRTAPAHMLVAPGLAWLQETTWRARWGNDLSLISRSSGPGGTARSSCLS
jgi:hypothetical protein